MRRTAALVGMATVWELYACVTANRLTPPLEHILAQLGTYVLDGELWFHGRRTLGVGLAGLGIASLGGVTLGVVMAANRWVDAALEPLLANSYAVPKLALYPAAALVLGIGTGSQLWLIALECLYPIAFHTYAGAKAIDRSLIWASRSAGAGRVRSTAQVVLPACLSSILTGVRIAVPTMLIVVVVSEVLGTSRGLGFLLIDAQARFQPAGVLAIVAVLGLLGGGLDQLVVAAIDRAVFWERPVR